MKKLLFVLPFLFGFTYPVDMDARYVAHNKITQDTTKLKAWPRADGMEITDLDPDYVILKAVDAVRPAFDADTQFLFPNMIVDIPAEEYRREWIIMTLDAEAQAEIQEDAEIETEKQQAIAVYQDLKNGVGTNGERIIRIEKTLAHILRMLYQP